MAVEYQGGCSSTLFCKDVDNMLPFNVHSVWNFASDESVKKRSSQPIVTGASVLGIVYNEGVMMCADTLGSYGSMARYFNCPRIMKVNNQVLLGAGGDIADFQYLQLVIEQSVIDDECMNDGFNLKPKSLHCWLTRTLYNRRSQFDPLWNVFAVGGLQDGVPFLGYVNQIGTSFESKTVASGFGAHLAQPILRRAVEKNADISQQEAQQLLHECMKILYVRDARSLPRYTLGVASKDGVEVSEPITITADWRTAFYQGQNTKARVL